METEGGDGRMGVIDSKYTKEEDEDGTEFSVHWVDSKRG